VVKNYRKKKANVDRSQQNASSITYCDASMWTGIKKEKKKETIVS
jgi:hypothetical protein